MRRRTTITAVTLGLLAMPAAAQAHVTINPNEAPAGGFTELLVRVPTERDNASTVKVDLKLPPGFAEASYEPQPGWKVKVTKSKLAKPIQTDDGPVTEQVSEIVWTGDGSANGKIAPGQFKDFPLSVQIPDKAGTTLTFKALQTYSNGEVVRWIGPPDAEEPAPHLDVTKAAAEGGHDTASADKTAAATPASSGSSDDGGGASKGLGIAALVVGILGLLAGGAALLMRGRSTVSTGS
jgi:uncharacterized protein